MPSEKRERQRANRQLKVEREKRAERRRKLFKKGQYGLAIIVVIAGIVFLATNLGSSKKAPGPAKGTVQYRQLAVDKIDAAAGCPSNPTAPVSKKTYKAPPPMTVNTSETYIATIKTDAGTIKIALDAKAAPVTVNNFLYLAASQFYTCDSFWRVIPGFMDQTGDPTGKGNGGPGYKFNDENIPPGLVYKTGEVAMANSGPNTNGSQFFILAAPYTVPPGPNNHGYSLFGQVIAGQNIVDAINQDGSSANNGATPTVRHRILSISISASASGTPNPASTTKSATSSTSKAINPKTSTSNSTTKGSTSKSPTPTPLTPVKPSLPASPSSTAAG